MSEKNFPAKKTYFGITALIVGIVSVLFSGASYGIVYLDISLGLFNILNNITALVFCSLTPITLLLGAISFTRKKDSPSASLTAIILVMIPALIVFSSLIGSFRR